MTVERATKRRKVSEEALDLPGFTKWNLEESYEKRTRKDRKPDAYQRLPFKTAHGQVIAQAGDEEKESEASASDGESEAVSGDGDIPVGDPEPQLSHTEQVIAAKEELARVAELVSSSPEEQVGLLKRLQELAISQNETVKKLALGTQLAVYKDIIPGYRIRSLGKEDLQGKLTKEVRLLRTFEQGLVSSYSAYIKTLTQLCRHKSNAPSGESSLATVATACVCALLQAVSHFNFRNDLIDVLVRQVSRSSPDDAGMYARAVACFESVFEDDDDGHTSLEIVTRLAAMMKRKDYSIHESLLNTFLHLRLLSEYQGKASTDRINGPEAASVKAPPAKKKREFQTKRQRKHMRELKEVEKEMKEADAIVSHEERDKFQGETLKIIFVTYFRILKARIPHLSGAVLEGLARYAHLINQDFFGDVLEVLRELVAESSTRAELDDEELSSHSNASREALLCTTTAFAMLQGQVDVMKSAGQLSLDLSFFTAHLYRSLYDLSLDADIELSEKNAHLQDPNGLATSAIDTKVNVATTTVLLMRSLQAVLLPAMQSRSVPAARLAAFIKQLLSASLHLPARSAHAIVGLLMTVVKVHGLKIVSLWNTEERRGDGVYNAASDEPESANAFAATAWEGEILKHHFDPKVRDAQKDLQRAVREAGK